MEIPLPGMGRQALGLPLCPGSAKSITPSGGGGTRGCRGGEYEYEYDIHIFLIKPAAKVTAPALEITA